MGKFTLHASIKHLTLLQRAENGGLKGCPCNVIL